MHTAHDTQSPSVENARNCFERAIAKERNVVSLRNLSMLVRRHARVEADVAESVTHAKAAIALDVRDGESWGMLGNAYMADYFGGSREAAALLSALTAYNNAEKNLATSTGGASPDLFFNRGMVR